MASSAGSESSTSPVAMSIMSLASCAGSRGRLGRFVGVSVMPSNMPSLRSPFHRRQGGAISKDPTTEQAGTLGLVVMRHAAGILAQNRQTHGDVEPVQHV